MILDMKFVYIEFDIFCIFMLCVILHRIFNNLDQGTENLGFRNVVISVLCGTLLDCLWEGYNGTLYKYSWQINKAINFCVIIMVCVVAFLWLLYVEERLHDRWENKSTKKRCLLLLPLFASIIMAILSITTDTVISLDQNNSIQYGKYYILIVLFPVTYLLYASAKILRHRKSTKNRQERGADLAMLYFLFLPMAGGILSAIRSDIPAVWPSCALPLFVIYINEQGYQISTDKLTGLNNRYKFDSYLDEILSQHKDSGNIYLFMCDIDYFKVVNDTYGHYEGDQALKETAVILKKICKTHDAFIARYGGDEFAIIAYFEDRDDAEALRSEIFKAFLVRNENTNKAYKISLSIGISQYENNKFDFFDKADKAMYVEKHHNKDDIS